MTLATFCVSTTLVALANVALQDTLLVWPIPCACFRQPSWPLVLAFAVPEYVFVLGRGAGRDGDIEVGVGAGDSMDETKKNHAAYQDGQARRILMLNDNPFTSELVGLMIGLCFECEFDPVQSGELAIRRLLDRRYDLVFLDSHFPDVDYSKLPTDMAATYQTIPKERHFIGGVKVWTAGERLFRLLRSPEVSHLGWATDVGSVPVIFLTGGPSTLNRAIIRTMPPVAILAMPAKSQDIISTVKELLGWAETGE